MVNNMHSEFSTHDQSVVFCTLGASGQLFLFHRFVDAWKFSQQENPSKYGCAEMNKKKSSSTSPFHVQLTHSQPKTRMTTCPNFQSKQQIGFASTTQRKLSAFSTLDLTLGTLQQFSSFLSACETPQTGVRHWSNTSTDKKLVPHLPGEGC